ncbi:MAG: shikimate kinase [Proteobacteria bacterium]|nr:shikimate kinase [Pseudomonadota bacterium]
MISRANTNIVLTGFMGVGKDTVGKIVAQRIGYRFISTDELIEKKSGMPLSKIISEKGEDYLHEIESKVLEGLIHDKKGRMVISTGGEIVACKENCELLKKTGVIIYIYTKPRDILDRMIKTPNKRPQFKDLKDDDLKSEVNSLMKSREKMYESIKDISIDAFEKSPLQTAEEVIEAWSSI